MIIFKNLVEMLGGEVVWASNVGLCDGILADYVRSNHMAKNTRDFTEDIISVTRQVAKHYESDMDHTQNVEQLSMAIFDSIRKFSGLTQRDRLLLQVSGILHDCGKYVNMMHCRKRKSGLLPMLFVLIRTVRSRNMRKYPVRWTIWIMCGCLKWRQFFDWPTVWIGAIYSGFRMSGSQ